MCTFSEQNVLSHYVYYTLRYCCQDSGNKSARMRCSKKIGQENENARAVDVSSNRNSERPPRKCFRCGSEDHMIAKCPKPPKDNEKWRKQVRFNEKRNCACDNGEDNYDHKIYAYMARMSSDDERKSVKYGDSSKLVNWILDLGAKCHMTPEVTDLIPGSLEDTDKYIEVEDGHHVTDKQKSSVGIKCSTITEKNSSQPYRTYS